MANRAEHGRRVTVVVLAVALGLAACAPQVRFLKEGVTSQQAAADLAQCRSTRDDVYYEQIRRIEEYYRYQPQTLSNYGTVFDQAGYGRAQDAAGERATARCMAAKGYRMVVVERS